ncbi:MAG: hypothetical protein IJI14_06335 [Anaerolineaceae bacterium]|nr:hypothetical protein [Anaerolineaceae bacterium]
MNKNKVDLENRLSKVNPALFCFAVKTTKNDGGNSQATVKGNGDLLRS